MIPAPAFTTLAKYGIAVGIVLICLAAIWFTVRAIHNNGREVEKSICSQEMEKHNAALADELGKAMQRMADEHAKQQENLSGALNDREKAIAEQKKRIAEYAAANRGLWVHTTTTTCPTTTNNSETGGASTPISGPSKTRLSEVDERFLESLADDADSLVIQYDTLRAACRPLVEIAP